MPAPEIEEFARILIKHVRDATVRSCDANLRPDVNHVVSKRWKGAGMEVEPIARVLIPDIVDDTIFHLLNAIDQGLLHLGYTDRAGKAVDLPEEGLGELAGWYMGSGGWRAEFSDQRFVDDFSDLAGE